MTDTTPPPEHCLCDGCKRAQWKLTTLRVCHTLTNVAIWGIILLFIPQWVLYLTAVDSYASVLITWTCAALCTLLVGSAVTGWAVRRSL